MSDLKKEFEFYLKNQVELVQKFNGKHIVIKDEQVLGAYDSELEAIAEAKKQHQLGTFIVQLVTPGNTAYTQTFHSRVSFG